MAAILACLVLLEAGHQLLVVDVFSNISAVTLERVALFAGFRLQRAEPTLKAAPRAFIMVEGVIRDAKYLEALFASAKNFGNFIEFVFHLLASWLLVN